MIEPDVPDLSSPPAPTRSWLLVAAAASVVVALDQVAKVAALRVLDQPVAVVPGVALRLSFNTGAAFSSATSFTPLITVLATVAVLGIAWVARRLATTGWALAGGLVGGGAAGNLVDRLLRPPGVGRGAVVDYIDVSWFAAFNLADVAITTGAVLAVVLSLRGVPATCPPPDSRAAGGRTARG